MRTLDAKDERPRPSAPPRPEVRGKFLWVGDRKLYVNGVTYGTFRPGPEGEDYPEQERVERDFAAIAWAGFNTVRTYTTPPRRVLDAAARNGLMVMVGLPWEQHVAFLDDRARARSIEERVRAAVRGCAGHPAVLCYTVGNEIPASIVRWHGPKRIQRFLHRLYRAAKAEDPGGLVTYVNFPTTEYLDLPFLDFCAFNVYLEEEERLESYLKRLQVLAGDRPLLMAEIGLDSRRNGESEQAASLASQIRTAFRMGCAGVAVFAWTDEWHRGGHDIDDWDFGLVRRDRSPKPVLAAVAEALADVPPLPEDPPRISAVVCSYNGARTIRATLEALGRVRYPHLEVIVVDDGSTDATRAIAAEFPVRVITTPNRGLSAARNTGAEAATGEIVAYVDDDAEPDVDWATYLAIAYRNSDFAAVGGPNLPPPGDSAVAECVSNAPGGPIHVLLTDDVAEHVPGCNLSVRRDALMAIGGFDPSFRVAGDDVDFCWRIQDSGRSVGFAPAAVVWHHRRDSVRAYWRQQRGYGNAEGMLERKWPRKYNHAGHVTWLGRIYGPGSAQLFDRWRIYYGTWGSGFFQGRHRKSAPGIATLPLMPEWYLVIGLLAVLTALGASWRPLLVAAPLLGAAIVALCAQALIGGARARFTNAPKRRLGLLRLRALCAALFLVQALARLVGRIRYGLAPWGRRARIALRRPLPHVVEVWSEEWRSAEERLRALDDELCHNGIRVRSGSDYDRWDLEVRGGGIGRARVRLALEEHGGGKQLARFMVRPHISRIVGAAIALGILLAISAGLGGGTLAAAVLGTMAVALSALATIECAAAIGAVHDALRAARASARSEDDPLEGARPVSLRRRLALLSYVRPHMGGIMLLVLSVVVTSLLTLAVPWPVKIVVDYVLGDVPVPGWLGAVNSALPGSGPTGLIVVAVIAAMLTFFLSMAVELFQSVWNVRVGQRLTYALASDVFAHLQKLSIVFHGRRPVGDTIARVNQDTFGMHSMLAGVCLPILQSVFTLVAMFVIMFQLSPELTLLALCVVPLQFVAILVCARPMKERSRDRLDHEGRLINVVQQTLTSLPAVQAFTRERIEHERFRRHADRTIVAYVRETLAGMWFKLFVGLGTALGTAGIMYLGAQQALDGRLTTGTIVVFLAYLAGLYAPLDSIAYTASGFQAAAAQIDRVIEVLDTKPDVEDRRGADARPIAAGHVRFEGVGFSYERGRPVLQDITLEARPGEMVAIVGPTGAGKTTLVNLLVRFFDPDEGRVTIDGRDLRDWKVQSLRAQIAMVLQEPFILPMSVAENIAYGNPGANLDSIVAAAKAANAHEFIERLPDGYDTVVGERGMTLSGGEKQRLSIARAFLKDARILILDEPTSALDARTEGALLDALERLSLARTSFVIAHRLSTIRNADRIVVIDRGRIVEQGSHHELVARDGLYAALYAQQMDISRHESVPGEPQHKRFRRPTRPAAEPAREHAGATPR